MKKKLRLGHLKIESFVTTVDPSAVLGGSEVTNQVFCVSGIGDCATVYYPSVNAACTDTHAGPCVTVGYVTTAITN